MYVHTSSYRVPLGVAANVYLKDLVSVLYYYIAIGAYTFYVTIRIVVNMIFFHA